MKIQQLDLVHFRNYEELSTNFHDGLTILTGENAQGKTNILEAIFLLSLAKSHRTNKDQEMIQWGQEIAKISALVENQYHTFPLELQLSSKGKIAKYNYLDQKKLSQFIGKLNVILFAPEDMQLVKGSPGLRRKYLDTELGQSHPLYLQNLLDYHHLLKQRNIYLKQLKDTANKDLLFLEIITEQLIDKASYIITERLKFVSQLEKLAHPIHYQLSNQKDHLNMKYIPSSSKLKYEEIESIQEQLTQLFKTSSQREIDLGMTLYGPHRDDLVFYINNNLADQFASQGQQRTIVLSLKLAELDFIYQLTHDYPVLLLDDVLSELDDHRQLILMQQIEGKVQTLLTTASIDNIRLKELNHATIKYVSQGQLYEEDMK